MPPGRLPGKVLWTYPTTKRPQGRPKSLLVWKCLGIPPEQVPGEMEVWECLSIPLEMLEEVAGEMEVCVQTAAPVSWPGWAVDNGCMNGAIYNWQKPVTFYLQVWQRYKTRGVKTGWTRGGICILQYLIHLHSSPPIKQIFVFKVLPHLTSNSFLLPAIKWFHYFYKFGNYHHVWLYREKNNNRSRMDSSGILHKISPNPHQNIYCG